MEKEKREGNKEGEVEFRVEYVVLVLVFIEKDVFYIDCSDLKMFWVIVVFFLFLVIVNFIIVKDLNL